MSTTFIEVPSNSLTEEEIVSTFSQLGLPTAPVSGYQYVSAPAAPARVFEVVRTNHSGPRG